MMTKDLLDEVNRRDPETYSFVLDFIYGVRFDKAMFSRDSKYPANYGATQSYFANLSLQFPSISVDNADVMACVGAFVMEKISLLHRLTVGAIGGEEYQTSISDLVTRAAIILINLHKLRTIQSVEEEE